MLKSKFIRTLSESRNIFALEQKAIASSFVKKCRVFIGTPGIICRTEPGAITKRNDLFRKICSSPFQYKLDTKSLKTFQANFWSVQVHFGMITLCTQKNVNIH